MTRPWRLTIAAGLTLWLAGWVPSIVYSWKTFGTGPQFYAWWIILGPMGLYLAGAAAFGLWLFYRWALRRPSHADLQERIDALERELGVGRG